MQLAYGCSTSKETYYSYTVGTYTFDTVKHFFYSDNLISYGDYLFEFKKKINIHRIVHKDSDSTSTYSDTIGVYLLSSTNKLYYEFDTFSLKHTVVKVGKIADKQFGLKFNSLDTGYPSDVSFKPAKKILINNINCFIAEIVSNNKIENDSIVQKIILIKKVKFNSLYKVNGIKFPDSNYCIVGFKIYDLMKKQNF
jgi:hypothetical protein